MNQHVPLLPYILETDSNSKIFYSYRSVVDSYPLHCHDFYEMELITFGCGRQWINNEYVPLQPGSMYICTPSDIHRVEADEPLSILSIHFLPEIISQMHLAQVHDACITQLDTTKLAFFSDLAFSVIDEKNQNLPYQDQQRLSVTMLMLIHLLREGTHVLLPPAGQHVQMALKYIAENYTDPNLRLNDVARISGLSSCHFSTLFNSIVGCGFSEYLSSHRLRRAAILLANPDISVTEVAYEVGFSTLSHFFRCFRNAYGCTPKQYRQHLSEPDITDTPLPSPENLRWISPLVPAPEICR